jgi:uridine kinase
MNTATPCRLIALVGGSGSGKSWLANRLREEFGDNATSLSLDDFYHDLSHLTLSEREKNNFDHPDAIDWLTFETVMRTLQGGVTAWMPRYDFVSHTRSISQVCCDSRPLIFVEGLWLLWPPHIRALFDLRLFLDCSETLRWQRRLLRDRQERGRTSESIHEQFWDVVAPMHRRFVEVQKPWADFVAEQPLGQTKLDRIIATIRALRSEPARGTGETVFSQITRTSSEVLHFL